MAEKIKLLEQDQTLYQKLHHNAWETSKDYCITATTNQLLTLYQGLIK